jgi:hypothetical protein
MIKIEANWRMRPACAAVFVTSLAIPGVVALFVTNAHRTWEYERIAHTYEGMERLDPPGLAFGLWSLDKEHPDGLHTCEAFGGTMSGCFAHGRASGTWDAYDSSGRLRGHVAMEDGQPNGPCEFWDPSGAWRIRGSYKNWYRAGLWSFDNVLGDGRKYVLYSPAWSMQ